MTVLPHDPTDCLIPPSKHAITGFNCPQEHEPSQPSASLLTAVQTGTPWIMLPLPDNKVGSLEERMANLSTHMQLWPASRSLFCWLEKCQHRLGIHQQGLQIIELGSGIGWLGQNLALNLPFADILLTDRPEVALTLAADIQTNGKEGRTAASRVEPLDWDDFTPSSCQDSANLLPIPAKSTAFDLVLGADLVWNSATAKALPWVIKALLEQGAKQQRPTKAIYGHWCRSPKPVIAFEAECEAACLVLEDQTDLIPDACSNLHAELTTDAEHASGFEASSDDSDETNWMAEIFNEKSFHDEPVFKVWSISLK